MARMFAKFVFPAVLLLLMTGACSAQQSLEAVSIGGFTWNLTESNLESFANEQPAAGINPASPLVILGQSPRCLYGTASRQDLTSAQNDTVKQSLVTQQQLMFDRFPFCAPDFLRKDTCAYERCYVLENAFANTRFANPETRTVFARNTLGQFGSDGVANIASNVIQATSNKMVPIVTSFANGIFQTASSTAQHARFPIENFSRTSVESLKKRIQGLGREQDSEDNPLRITESLKPALQPIVSATNFNVPASEERFWNPTPPIVGETRMAKVKSPEEMDTYWNYYADCDRWNVVISGDIADNTTVSNSNNQLPARFGWVEQLVATAANVEIWMSQAIGQLELQSNSIGRDFQATWNNIEFHLFQISSAGSQETTQDVNFWSSMRNPR